MRLTQRQLDTKKGLVGRIVRLSSEIRTKGGTVYAAGTLWKVCASGTRGRPNVVDIEGVDATGQTEIVNGCIARYVRNVSTYNFEIARDFPLEQEPGRTGKETP